MIQYRLCFTNVGKNISITSSWRITDQTFERRHYNNSNSSCWLIQRSRFIPSFTGTGSLEWKTGKTWWVKQVRWRLAREGGGGGGNRTEELYQGHSQDFSRGTHNFSNLPPPPTPHLTLRSTHIDIIVLSFVYCKDRPEWKIECSCFIPSCLLSAHILVIIIQLSGVEKSVHCFTKNTPKNQRELNRIEAIYIAFVVVLIFTLSFFNYSHFYYFFKY